MDEIKNAIDAVNHELAGSQSVNNEQVVWWTTQSAMTMCASILIFCIVVLGFVTYLLKSGAEQPEAILRMFGTIIIIIVTVFLVVAGYNDQQIAPAIGLLGTIAGYLLGKDVKKV
ncbi:hypothetical protein [Desulfovibrio sp. DV]|uniref:hypothetical protein n=1 Tax=Desulfovibrio sp. DV TaxID=1844708 RepID=UPI00111546F1|nr:hypothetical protein [Desulfovibrio sp. DV]